MGARSGNGRNRGPLTPQWIQNKSEELPQQGERAKLTTKWQIWRCGVNWSLGRCSKVSAVLKYQSCCCSPALLWFNHNRRWQLLHNRQSPPNVGKSGTRAGFNDLGSKKKKKNNYYYFQQKLKFQVNYGARQVTTMWFCDQPAVKRGISWRWMEMLFYRLASRC